MNILKHLIIFTAVISAQPTFAMKALKNKQEDVAKEQLENAQAARATRLDLHVGTKPKFSTRSLIIFFDPQNTETKFGTVNLQTGAITRSLVVALFDACAPIIVHRSTWNNLKRLEMLGTPLIFSESDWYIYTTSDTAMMIFIPKKGVIQFEPTSQTKEGYFQTYIDKINDNFIAGQQTSKTVTINGKKKTEPLMPLSDSELVIGMKLRSLKPEKNLINLIVPNKSLNLRRYLQEILVTRADLFELNINDGGLNMWDICLMGHGESTKFIAGMDMDSFKSLLDFLNTKIITRSFMYTSCHAGAHLEAPYQFTGGKETQSQEFNFLAISATVFDLKLSSAFGNDAYKKYFAAIDKYFQENMKENKNHYLTDAINSFNYISLSNAFSGVAATTDDTIIQYPAVRYPHTQWFRLADVEAYFVFLLNNGAIIRAVNKNKEITVARKYTTILIESRYVPIPLITEGGGMPLLAPQKVNSIPYFFKEIRANDCTINSFNAMLANLKTKMPKVGNFYIEKLVLKGQEYHNVIIEGGPTWKHSKGLNPSSPHMKQFNEMKKEIRKTSTLPESMKQEEPKPVIELIPPTQPGARAIIKGNTSRK